MKNLIGCLIGGTIIVAGCAYGTPVSLIGLGIFMYSWCTANFIE